MKKAFLIGGALAVAIFISFSCSTVPLTGRSQLSLLPESSMVELSLTSYDSFLKENKLSSNAAKVQQIKRVGTRVSQAVEIYLSNNGFSGYIENFDWEFNLVDNDVPNAWCMPGGKVVFYTGILPIAQTDAGIAVVMGHEIAHAVARHGNERMSQSMVLEMGGMALTEALRQKPRQTRALFSSAYGLGSQLGVTLPFSRRHELEADEMGLIFMAMAGYDPRETVAFWKRMAAHGGAETPEFLSTHPVDSRRIAELEKLMPEAMVYYNMP
ncbi:MAG: M48 family metallopeptidase [Mangrovibacterium sp.]